MKRAGIVSYAAVVATIVLGSIAVAAPSFQAALDAPSAAATGATGSGGTGGDVGPPGASGPTDRPAPRMSGRGGPDVTACEGLTGLDKAICRHEALLVVHPDNEGLQQSHERLRKNRAEHEERKAEREAKQQSRAEGTDDHPGGGNGGNPHEANEPEHHSEDGPSQGNAKDYGNPNGHDEGDAGEG